MGRPLWAALLIIAESGCDQGWRFSRSGGPCASIQVRKTPIPEALAARLSAKLHKSGGSADGKGVELST